MNELFICSNELKHKKTISDSK